MKKWIFLLLSGAPLDAHAQESIASKIMADISDTFATGMPIAVFAGIWWAVANRVPKSWKDLPEPAAGFIRTTWKEQGFADADRILLKEIPARSLFARVIMYTQELPYALAVGIPFRRLIERCLKKKEFLNRMVAATKDPEEIARYRSDLEEVEKQLYECRFVCGHERVHKEKSHTIRMLIIQFIAPFIVHSMLKHTANALDRRQLWPAFSCLLRRGFTRSTIEMIIFWCSAHWYERQADLYASTDPEVIKAGISLFERARQRQGDRVQKWDPTKMALLWILKYTHPTTPERIGYLKKALVRNKKLRVLHTFPTAHGFPQN